MNGRVIDRAEFAGRLATVGLSAFRFETRRQYNVPYERDDLARWKLDGSKPRGAWWAAWRQQIAGLTAAGVTIVRVRLIDDPPTPYQRWELALTADYTAAGEVILWLPRAVAREIGLPLGYDWWLLDNEQLMIMKFNDADEVAERILVTEPDEVARHRAWRDLAISHAHPAEQIAA